MAKVKERRFYRPPPPFSNLARIVWHPKAGRAIAEFGKETNQFFTTDDWVADELLKLGYEEIALDLDVPPHTHAPVPPVPEVGDIKINPHLTEELAAGAEKRKAILNAPPTPEKKKADEKPKSTPATEAKAKAPVKEKRTIKRRKKAG